MSELSNLNAPGQRTAGGNDLIRQAVGAKPLYRPEAPVTNLVQNPPAGAAQTAQQPPRQEFLDFAVKYPEISPGDIPREVLSAVLAGESFETAYLRHENARLREQLQALTNNKRVRAASVGSVAGDAAAQAPEIDEGWAAYMEG